MHELAVTESIMGIVLRHAEAAGAKRVTAIHLTIGELTGLVDDSIQFYFDFIGKDTLAEGARLTFKRVPARARCHQCGNEFEPDTGKLWTCPACEAIGGDVVAGREFFVDSIEVE
ncbi:MAG: hydrogenase maturation nickel metallochaperone HypA [Chloroflexi bacterium]|nr:hydrogenase maturation nickel metallochaperone HypA [Chloroflexota bacterium]MBU1750541.1 hydrogenase maturation nickel metallochaperone HypA [Chloroflexota bacterium]MBU1878079.1 hydrogenase maturation nickel metallochaperone HypA [Chloroflexota bacterium]